MFEIQGPKIESEIFENPLYSLHLKVIRLWGLIIATNQKYTILHAMRAYFVIFSIVCVPILNLIKFSHSLNDLEECAICCAAAFLYLSLSVVLVNACIQRRRIVKLVTYLHNDLKSLLSNADATEEIDLQNTIHFQRHITLLLLCPSLMAAMLSFTDCIYRTIFLPESVFNMPEIINGTAQPILLHKLLPFGEVYDSFIIGFIYPFYAGCLASTLVPIAHTFMICLMSYVILKFRIIQKRMRQLDISTLSQNSFEYSSHQNDNHTVMVYDLEYWHLQLCKFCTDEQNKLRWFVHELEIFLRVPIFADFLICTLLICFSLYAISSGLLTKLDYAIVLVIVQVILSMLWLYYWHATLIAQCNDDLRFAIYSSDWYMCTLKVQKSLRLIMTDTQKPLQMRAFFIDMNLNTFINILRGAFGYFSILRNVSAK